MNRMMTVLAMAMALGISKTLPGETQTLQLDAQSDCVLLDAVTTVVGDLQAGKTYTVNVSSSGITGAPMQGAFFMYEDAAGTAHFRYVDDGGSFTFQPVAGSYQLAPLYVDWSTTNDNSGKVTITISGPTTKTVVLDSYSDCYLLNSSKVVGSLTADTNYTVSVSNSGISGSPMQGAFFMYEDSTGSAHFQYVDNGGSFSFKPVSGSYQLAPLYVDWSSTSDNLGKVDITISSNSGDTDGTMPTPTPSLTSTPTPSPSPTPTSTTVITINNENNGLKGNPSCSGGGLSLLIASLFAGLLLVGGRLKS